MVKIEIILLQQMINTEQAGPYCVKVADEWSRRSSPKAKSLLEPQSSLQLEIEPN
jgi:hypothetical protein